MGAWLLPAWSLLLLLGRVGLVAWRIVDVRRGIRVGMRTWSPFWVALVAVCVALSISSLSGAMPSVVAPEVGLAVGRAGTRSVLTVCVLWGLTMRALAWWERR